MSIAAMIATGKSAIDLLKSVKELTSNDKASKATEEIASVISALHSAVRDLEKENQGLRERVKHHEDWERKKVDYELSYPFMGVAVMKRIHNNGGKVIYACPNCFEEHKAIPLSLKIQQRRDSYFTCPACQLRLDIGYQVALKIIETMNDTIPVQGS